MKPNHINEQCAALSQPTELKPCWSCGTTPGSKDLIHGPGMMAYCDNDKCGVYGMYVSIATWNTRALDTRQPPDAGLVDEYKERADAWGEVWGKCLALGADSSSHGKGIDVVLHFIEALAQHRQGEQWSATKG